MAERIVFDGASRPPRKGKNCTNTQIKIHRVKINHHALHLEKLLGVSITVWMCLEAS